MDTVTDLAQCPHGAACLDYIRYYARQQQWGVRTPLTHEEYHPRKDAWDAAQEALYAHKDACAECKRYGSCPQSVPLGDTFTRTRDAYLNVPS